MKQRSRGRRSKGQALLMACLLLGVMALAVLGVATIGGDIHERIRLQNAADAAAYSTAALEARAFNFYAFANRTQASHYVSAMTWQSYDSFIYGTEAFLTDFVGLLASLDVCANPQVTTAAVCSAARVIPGVAAVLSAIDSTLQLLAAGVQAFQSALEAVNPDQVIGRVIIPMHQTLNEVLAAASQAMLRSALSVVSPDTPSQRGGGTLKVNAPQAQVNATLPSLNRCLFARSHADAAGVTANAPFATVGPLDASARKDDDKVARAKRAMAIVANASRFGCDQDSPGGACDDAFVTKRSFAHSIAQLRFAGVVKLPSTLLGALIPKAPKTGEPMKYGHTRLLSLGLARGTSPQRIRSGRACRYPLPNEGRPLDNDLRAYRDASGGKGEPAGYLGQGDNLGADDLYVLGVGPAGPLNPFACGADDDWRRCWGNQRGADLGQMVKESVWALNPRDDLGGGKSIHFRLDRAPLPVDPRNRYSGLGLIRVQHCLGKRVGCSERCLGASLDVFVANVRPMLETNHPWRGMTPFAHFEPGLFAEECSEEKSGDSSASAAADRNAEFNQPSVLIELQQKLAALPPPIRAPARELHAFSRAQTYYHRPGNWQEHPNFFNPYWRPRLASLYQGRSSLPPVEALLQELPPELAQIAQKVLTH